MQKEKIALIALVVIVVAALSVFVTAVNTNIFENLFKEKLTILEGDCADVNYIGRYTSNNTIFDTSYTYPQNKSGGTPIKIFVSFDANATSPKAGYTKDMIKGFMNGLIGLSEGQTKIIGPIPPEDAYGAKKLTVGAIFTTQYLAFGMNQTVEVTNYTSENLSVKWIQMENLSNFTMPQMIINNLQSTNTSEYVIYPPPYNIWENSTSIINITDTNVTVRATPTKSTNLSNVTKPILYGEKYLFIFPNATTASWNNTTITVVCSPVIGQNYTFQGQGSIGMINYTVSINNITGDTINITITNEENPELSYLDLYRTLTFNRTFVLPRLYTDIPSMYVSYFYTQDIEKAGYSLNPLAGESLTFEVVVEKVYKTSQGTS
jgi:FKBP-type peptidyl-prolyl cis-trans isomerase 2